MAKRQNEMSPEKNGTAQAELERRMRAVLEQDLLTQARASMAPVAAENAQVPTAAARLEQDVTALALEALGVPAERFDPEAKLASYGFDSIAITELMARISCLFKVSIAPTTFFEARHLNELCGILRSRYASAIEARYAAAVSIPAPDLPAAAPVPERSAAARPDVAAWLRRHASARSSSRAEAQNAQPTAREAAVSAAAPDAVPVAIISMEGMFPRSADLEQFRAHLRNGDDCIEEVPADRWDWRAVWGDPRKGAWTDVKYGGFVSGHDMFDAPFFHISPREAELMDPQHRLFIECVWKLIERAGYAPGALTGKKVGVFLGINLLDYIDLANRSGVMDAVQLTGLGHTFCPNRISFLLDVDGPSQVIDTACSSSLVAVHRAVLSIRHEGCEMAIAGGSNLMLTPTQHIMFSKVGMICPDGRCKTFSADANGYARADGVGAVLLKRLDLAERDGDNIFAVIRGSAESHGGTASSLTAPNPAAQARLIVAAHRQAETDPRSIGMIECHGTGTALGDPIEVEGLKSAFATLYQERGLTAPEQAHCALGSVKSNIGHAETAAGIAGLIKVVLAMQDGVRYRSLHCDKPHPLIGLDATPFQLASEATPWVRPVVDGVELPRRAAVSSFGAGGAMAHLVLEEYQSKSFARARRAFSGPSVIVLSARDDKGLRAASQRLLDWLREQAGQLDAARFASLAYILQTGRDPMRERLALVARDAGALDRALLAFLTGDEDRDVLRATVERKRRDPVAQAETLEHDRNDGHAIARRWVTGEQVDWHALWGGETPPRIALPTYPFQRQRYWLPLAEGDTTGADGLRQIAPDCYALHLTGSEFFLDDHRIHGKPVLPGVAYIEFVRQAAQQNGLAGFRIRQLVWHRPLEVLAPLTLEIRLIPDHGDWPRVEIASIAADGTRRQHAQAKLGPASAEPLPARDMQALHASLSSRQEAQAIYQAFDAMGLQYGRAHRTLQSLALGEAAGARHVLACLQLPQDMAGTLSQYQLHPGLMDGAFQAAVGMAMDEQGRAGARPALPFALESVDILGACTPRMWAWVRPSNDAVSNGRVRKLDIDLLDDNGVPQVSMRGFATRVAEADAAVDIGADVSTLLYAPVWQDIVPVSSTEAVNQRFARRIALLYEGDAAACDQVGAQLPAWECRALATDQIEPGQRFTALATLLLQTLQALVADSARPPRPVLLQVVLSEASSDDSLLQALAGMLRSARLEHPWLCAQLVRVRSEASKVAVAEALAAAAALPQHAVVRCRDGHVQARGWRELPEHEALVRGAQERADAILWRVDGVYLITGGTGRIGRLLASHILRRAPGAHVVLTGRAPLQGELADWLKVQQESASARISYRQADVSDEHQVEVLVDHVRRAHGGVHGVFHCAGLVRDEALQRKSAQSLAAVLAPKVAGALALDRALNDVPLDFMVLFASLSGAFGNPGQADYAAANAFLDQFAEWREAQRAAGRRHGRTISIAWPLWREGGLRMEPAVLRLMRQTTGLCELETADALHGLECAMRTTLPQVLVLCGEVERVRRHVAKMSAPTANDAFVTPVPTEEVTAAVRSPAAAGPGPALRNAILTALMRSVSEQLKVAQSDLDPEAELTDFGFDSITFTQFANALNDRFGLNVTPTLFFEYPTLAQLAECLATEHAALMAAALGVQETPVHADAVPCTGPDRSAPPDEPPSSAAPVLHPASGATTPGAAVAIIGVTGVYPQARDLAAFWNNLAEGRDCIREVPPERWDWRAWWGDPAMESGRTNIKWGGFIDGLDEFDAAFFGLSAPEARAMDPQQRLLLTQAWRLMEDAGYAPRSLAGSAIGVFIGTADVGYGRLAAQAGAGVEGYSMTGLAPSLGPNRISFTFDFRGPSVAVETACSSALVAVNRAVEAIRGGGCDHAIAGGVNALLLPEAFVGFSKAGMLAPDGRCKPFSAQANGYVRGEGVGLVFLKRLDLAERDGDRILAVVRGAAENHGGRANSLTAPNPKSQAELIRRTWRQSGVDPRTVTYIEAHGTGTPLGDPIEIEALRHAFEDLAREAEQRFGPQPEVKCGIGSVKSVIGHLELAAGVAGLTKVLLQMHHGELAPSLHCDELNPYLKLEGSRFEVVKQRRSWERARDREGRELPRRAGISSFGFGGSNAHLVLEEYIPAIHRGPTARSDVAPNPSVMIVLSARSPEQLAQSARELAAAVTERMPLDEIASTLQCARDAMEYRLAFMAASHEQLRARLTRCAEGLQAAAEEDAGIYSGRVKGNRETLAILDADDEMRRVVASLPARGKHDSLLQLWVRGLDVDWRSLYANGMPVRRHGLPGYPFARTRYWVQGGIAVEPVTAVALLHAAESASQETEETARAGQPVASQPAVGEKPDDRIARALAALTAIAASVLEVDSAVLEPDTELGEYGFDSITMTVFANRANAELNLTLTPADFFEFATLQGLARHIAGAPAFDPNDAPPTPSTLPTPPRHSASMRAAAAPDYASTRLVPAPPAEQASTRREPVPAQDDDPVAIVGISCRFPMAEDAEAFWQNLLEGRDCITRIRPERWDWRAVDGDPRREPSKTNVHWGGFIDGVFEFDPLFFGISPREAKLMDPQQRLLMMHVWKAIEDAGHAPRSLAGRAVGLFAGTSSSGYREMVGEDTGGEGYVATGAVPSVGPNRISFFLDWHGPSEPVETACSSSLVALHRALQAMREGDCDMAIVGGVNTIVTPEAHINFAKASMLAVDGRCKTFSAEANGYGRGEGVGVIVLKRLSEALRDGDHVYGLVRGSAINHGGRANSLTAPNTAAQAAVLRAAYTRAGIDVRTVSYIEAHGTGTALGDPVEINALKSAFREMGATDAAAGYCGIGAVKSSIGHLELAAGIAGVIKVLLQMRHRTLVGSLHCANQNPYINLSDSPFYLVRKNQPWEASLDAEGRALPRRAGVSSFGFGGVNAHVVLEEYLPRPPAPRMAPEDVLVPLSARDEARLRDQAHQLLRKLAGGSWSDADLPDLAWTLQVGRDAMRQRLAVVVKSVDELRVALEGWLEGRSNAVVCGKADAKQAAGYAVQADLEEAARHWVAGALPDWAALQSGPRRRLSLPTYPFARETYLIGTALPGSAPPSAKTGGTDLVAPERGGRYRLGLDTTAFYLRDHQVRGIPVLPGAMTLELARLAHARAVNDSRFTPVAITQVVWLKQVTAGASGLQTSMALEPASGGHQAFRLYAAEGADGTGQSLHAQGQLAPLACMEISLRLEPDVIAARCGRRLEADNLYTRYRALGLEYGPAFRALVRLQVGTREVLASLALPQQAQQGAQELEMHPVLLDAAFQSCLGLFLAEDDGATGAQAALPFALDELRVLRPTTARMWAHARLASGSGTVRKIDIDIADEQGNVCLQARGFSLRLMRLDPVALGEAAVRTAAPAAALRAATERWFAGLLAAEAGLAQESIDPAAALEDYGLDSIMIARLTERLEQEFGRLSKTLFFEYQTLEALVGHFLQEHGARLSQMLGVAQDDSRAHATSGAQSPDGHAPASASDPIAIIGLAGRYPGAPNLRAFWDNLAAGRDCITEIPPQRWDADKWYDPGARQAGKMNSKWGGFIEDADCFDPLFFNISPREASYIDPQERLFLQCAWEAIEDAGYTRAGLARAEPPLSGAAVGVFVGVMYEEYQLYGAQSTALGKPLALGGSAASIANRVSYFCNFNGPSIAVDSMCSSSLSAIALACDSLRSGSCEIALAGGVNLSVHPNKYLLLAQGRFTSSKGRCESFGEGGDGYVPGEGVGAVLLKPLSRALADGDQIYGVIRGVALNHGGKTNGYSVPNPHAQTAVIGKALAQAGVDPDRISYVESHGTGTSLGDPIEVAALTRAFSGLSGATGKCAIGSVKSNIGHCESAAGIAGLTKVLLQLKHGQLVPSLHSARLNPGIDFSGTPFNVQQRLEPWPRQRQQKQSGIRELPRVAGLSSFGAGGANAHLVIEEYLDDRPLPARGQGRLDVFPVSARDPERLRELVQQLHAATANLNDDDMTRAAWVLQQGREAYESRVAILASDCEGLQRALASLLEGGLAAGTVAYAPGTAPDATSKRLAHQWVAGGKVDWRQLRGEVAPRRISLPTYPFARERYWVPGAEGEAGGAHEPLPLLFAPQWVDRSVIGTLKASEPIPRVVVALCEPPATLAEQLVALLAPAPCLVLDERDTGAPIESRFSNYAVRLLDLIQQIGRDRAGPTLLQVVVPLAGEQGLLEGVSGLLQSAAQEIQALSCQLLALDDVAWHDEAPSLAERVRREQATGEARVRLHGGQRLVRAWAEVQPDRRAGASVQWKGGGVYLITGGSGGLGLLLAEEAARVCRRPVLCLTSRSPLDRETQARLDAIPATVLHRQMDVARFDEVEAVLQELQARYGRVHGVIHAAGITRDCLLLRKSAAEMREVLAPKVTGAANLDRATEGFELDFMLLFASASGAFGNPGQSDYACANAWLDSFAAWRNSLVATSGRQGVTLAIDWPYWRDGGMRLDAATVETMYRVSGVRPLEIRPALAAMHLAMGTGLAQVLVLDGDHVRLRKGMAGVTTGMQEQPVPSAPTGAADARPAARAAAGLSHAQTSTPSDLYEKTVAWLRERFATALMIPLERVAAHETLDRYGIDSVLGLQVIEELERQLGALPRTLLFEYPKIAALAAALLETHHAALAALLGAPEPPPPGTVRQIEQKTALQNAGRPGDIAVIGVSGRYPGAETIEAFWSLLLEGRDSITEIPSERWDHAPLFAPDKGRPGTTYCKWGAFLSSVDCFDPDFFGINQRDAQLMDPQERLFLETVWHLFERAGHTRAQLQKQYDARVGVYVGAMYQPYHAVDTDPERKALVSLGSHASMANRVSSFFDLQGPSMAVDSMCSSGLQAVHLACQALARGECRLAVAGGVNLTLHASKYLGLSRAGMLGSHPNSRSFADADGYLPAEGVGAVLLKPMDDALRDGDRVLAVIKGSASNHGGRAAGYGTPSAEAQARLIEDNLRASGIDARSIGYVEAAANGSLLGDALEVRALTRAFRSFTNDAGFCALGSVKSNMGHAESASGMAQLTKVLLQLEQAMLVPSVRDTARNPNLQLAGTPFVLQATAQAWQRPELDGVEIPLRATVSSLGAGGSNVHLVLEEGPRREEAAAVEVVRLRRFTISARNPERLAEVARLLHAHLNRHRELSLSRLSHTLCERRERLDCCADLLAASREALLEQLDRIARRAPWKAPAESELRAVADAERREAATMARLPALLLPDYPFARERYWLPLPAHVGAPATPAPSQLGEAAVALRHAAANTEALLAFIGDIMRDELGLPNESLQPDRSFRAHGADSMFAFRLIHGLAEAAGVRLTHRDLETYATPAALAQYLASLQPDRAGDALQTTGARATAGQWSSPLSEGQLGLWVLQKLYPENCGYNVPLAFRVEGIGLGALERACNHMLERFPILSSRFEESDGTVRMRPLAAPRLLQVLTAPAGMDDLTFARERTAQPFRLSDELPIRFELLRGSGEIMLIVVHHIVFDGLSALSFTQSFWDAYERFSTGGAPAPQLPQHEYAEFVEWERRYLETLKSQADLGWWERQLAGELPVLRRPVDHARQYGRPGMAQAVDVLLTAERMQAVRQRSAELGISPASFFLGVLAILLYRYTGDEDILIGMPTLGRPARRFDNTIGYFANMLVMRARPNGTVDATALLRQMHAQIVDGLSHSTYPFSALMRKLKRTQLGDAPYQVTYSYQNFMGDMPTGQIATSGGARIHHLSELRQAGDGPFGLELFEDSERVRIVAGFDAARFDAARVRRMLDHYVRLIDSLLAASTETAVPIAALGMMAEAESWRILSRWSRAAAPPVREGTVYQWFERQATTTPDAIALETVSGRLSYRELLRDAERLAAHLRARGVDEGMPVAVMLRRGPGCVVVLLASLKIGAIWLPLDPAYPDQRLALIMQDADAGALVSDGVHETRLRSLAPNVPLHIQLERERSAIRRRSSHARPVPIEPASIAYLIYTSGSTGQPKGVEITQRALAAHCQAVVQRFALDADDRVLQFASHNVDAALEQILPALACGARVVLRDDTLWSPEEFRGVLTRFKPTVADLPPAYLHEILSAWQTEDSHVSGPVHVPRLLITGGEVLAPETVRLWRDGPLASAHLLNAYGPTEATITCTVHEVGEEAPGEPVPIGRPLAGGEIYILDRDGNPTPEGVPGELHVGGMRVANGYRGQSALTRERFLPNRFAEDGSLMYRTGDLACFVPGSDGVIAFRGRMDHQVKVRGFRVELGEIEAALRGFGFADALVEKSSGPEELIAYVVGDRDPDWEALRAHLSVQLPSPMLPSRIVRLEKLPLTPGGKIDRGALPSVRSAMTPVVATSMQRGQSENDAVEALLIRLWCSVLEREEIGRDDEFFRCGGHSLLAVRLLAAIQREFGCTLSMADLLQAPTPAQQAEALRRRLSEGEAKVPAVQAPSSLVTLRSEGRGEPLFLVHPVGGNVACYVDLARRLECDRPVYGLQALVSEFRGSRAAQPSLERLAANYVNALRERQKHGPYHLGGWSLGGVIAFEMAQQLRAAGEEVALLVLIDSYTPKLLERLESEHSSADGDQEGGLRRAFGRDFLGTAGPRALHGHEHELFEVFRTNVQAMQAYAPKPYQGPVTLLSAAEGGPADAAHGWAPLVPAGLALHTLPGDHYSILKPPQLDNLVQALERALRGLASLSTVNDPNPETHINK